MVEYADECDDKFDAALLENLNRGGLTLLIMSKLGLITSLTAALLTHVVFVYSHVV